MTFHGKSRYEDDPSHPVKEKFSMTFPLIMLAVPSLLLGGLLFGYLFSATGWLGGAITHYPHNPMKGVSLPDFFGYATHALSTWPFILSVLGIALAWFNTLLVPSFPNC